MTLMPGKLTLTVPEPPKPKELHRESSFQKKGKPKMHTSGRISAAGSMRSSMGDFITKYRDSKMLVLPDEKEFKRYQNMIPEILNES